MIAQPEVAMIQEFAWQRVPIVGQTLEFKIDRSWLRVVFVARLVIPPLLQRLSQQAFLRVAATHDGQKVSSEIRKSKLCYSKL